jgi:uncharacterized protein (TIGR02284 family)
MSNQALKARKIADAVKVLHGGIDFYQQAIEEIKHEQLRSVFGDMVRNKQKAIDALQPFTKNQQGENEYDSDCIVHIRQLYTKLIGKFSCNKPHTYIKQLEEVEDRVLNTLDDALAERQPPQCAIVLRTVREKAQKMHDEMKEYQEASA